MSFPALFIAAQATEHCPPLEDDEFGLNWSDLEYHPDMHVTWAMYETVTGAIKFGVKSVELDPPGLIR